MILKKLCWCILFITFNVLPCTSGYRSIADSRSSKYRELPIKLSPEQYYQLIRQEISIKIHNVPADAELLLLWIIYDDQLKLQTPPYSPKLVLNQTQYNELIHEGNTMIKIHNVTSDEVYINFQTIRFALDKTFVKVRISIYVIEMTSYENKEEMKWYAALLTSNRTQCSAKLFFEISRTLSADYNTTDLWINTCAPKSCYIDIDWGNECDYDDIAQWLLNIGCPILARVILLSVCVAVFKVCKKRKNTAVQMVPMETENAHIQARPLPAVPKIQEPDYENHYQINPYSEIIYARGEHK